MTRMTRGISAMLFVLFATTACFGGFNLTRKLYNWNASPDDKWVQEGYYLVTGVLLPVYGIAVLADAVVFNTIEFWTGDNPVQIASDDEEGALLGEAEVDGEAVKVNLKVEDSGQPYLTVTHTVNGEVERILNVMREGNETHVVDEDGNRVLSASHLSDGGMLIKGMDGDLLAFVEGAEIQSYLSGLATGETVPSEFAAAHFGTGGAVTAQ